MQLNGINNRDIFYVPTSQKHPKKKQSPVFFFATEFEQKCIKDIRSGKESEMVDLISGGEIEMQIKE